MTHVGYEADQALARAVPAIDVIVGGHTHSVLGNHPHSEGPYPTVIPHDDGSLTLVVQAGRSTRYLGRLSVSFDDAGRIVQFKGDLEELVPSLRRDEAMHEIVVQSLEAIRADQKRFVGVNSSTLPDGLDPCREGDCLSGMATADAFLAWGRSRGAVAAILNGGAIRAAMPIGPVTYADLLDIHPFGNRIQLADVSGAVLREALEHGISEPDVIGPRVLQTAGLRYRLNPVAPVGQRIVSAEILTEKGTWESILPENVYRIVTISYLLGGGDHFRCSGNTPRFWKPAHWKSTFLKPIFMNKRTGTIICPRLYLGGSSGCLSVEVGQNQMFWYFSRRQITVRNESHHYVQHTEETKMLMSPLKDSCCEYYQGIGINAISPTVDRKFSKN